MEVVGNRNNLILSPTSVINKVYIDVDDNIIYIGDSLVVTVKIVATESLCW